MREHIEIARARTFSDIITDTFGLFRQNFKQLLKACLVICGLFIIANIIIAVFVRGSRQDSSFGSFTSLFQLFIGFISYVLMISTVQAYFVLYKERGNQQPRLIEVWGYVRYYFLRIFWSQFLLLILTAAGTFLCVLPGIYLGVVFSLVTPIMVIENANFQYAFNKSFQIIKGNWWFSFGLLLIISLIICATMLALFIPAIFLADLSTIVSGKSMEILVAILFAMILAASQLLLVLPFTSATLIYYALTEEKEGTSLLDRISSFGKKDSDQDQLSTEQY